MPLQQVFAYHDCPEVVVDLFVVVVGVVVAAVDADEDDEALGVAETDVLDDLLVTVADDPTVVADVAVADDALAVDETSRPRPTAPAVAVTPITAVIRRTRAMARSRSSSA